MKKRCFLLLLTIIATLTFCGCESKTAKLEREAKEAQKRSQEAHEKYIEAKQKVDFLEALLGK